MQHTLRFTNLDEKLQAWLNLCDFTFHLMKNSLSAVELKKRIKKIRRAHLKEDIIILSKLARFK